VARKNPSARNSSGAAAGPAIPGPAPDHNGDAERTQAPPPDGAPAPAHPTPQASGPDNGRPPESDAATPDGPADARPRLADLGEEAGAPPTETGAPSAPAKRPLIPGIDLDSLALEDSYEQSLAGDDSLTVVVRKASGQGYFRAHPALFRNIWALEVKNGQDRGFYLVAGEARKVLRRDENEDVKLFPCRLTLCYARDSGLFLWPLRLPEEGRKNQVDEWSQAALRIVKLAEAAWVKMYTKRGGNCYSYKIAEGITTEPPWPEGVTLNELAGLAFEGKYIIEANDPLVRRLLGRE
jgi:hypothetical protein